MKNGLEFWNNENEEENHDGDGHDHDNDRINHGRFDLVPNLCRLFLELGQTRQNDFENTAELARFHHVDVEVVEDGWMLGQRIGKGGAALNAFRQLVNRSAQNRIAFLFGEHG